MAFYGYDPERIEVLHRRTRDALDALVAIRSGDPLADDAMRAAAQLRDDLELAWLPVLEAIRTSTAMTAWREALAGWAPTGLGGPSRRTGSSWVATNGLDHLTDSDVVARLVEAIDAFRDAVLGAVDAEPAGRRLALLADEARRRSRHDPARFAALLEAGFEGQAAPAILGAVDALDASARSDPRRHGIPPPALDLAELLASLTDESIVVDWIGTHLCTATSLAPLIAATSRSWDPDVLVEVTLRLITAIEERRRRFAPVTPIDLAGNVADLAVALADDPSAALDVLGDERALRYVATNHSLHASSVEALLTAGLLRSGPGATLRRRLEALRSLIDIAGDELLTDGAKRGVAASMLGFLPFLAPQLDPRLPVVVPYGAGTRSSVELGRYCDLQHLLGQVLTDVPAQLVLGAVTEQFRTTQAAGLADAIARRPADDAAEHRARIAAALADVSAVVALVSRSRTAKTALDAFEHGALLGRAKAVIAWAALAGTVAVPPSRTVLATAIPVASQVLTSALDLTEPERLPDLGLDAAAAIGFTVTVIGIPARAPQVRAALGLAAVPASTWRRLNRLLTELVDTGDHDRRLTIHSSIVAIAAADHDLDLYVTQLDTLTGDAANAIPQPPAGCE